LWTRGIIRELIRQRFGILLSDVTVGRILKSEHSRLAVHLSYS
jgi:hypothetical protein